MTYHESPHASPVHIVPQTLHRFSIQDLAWSPDGRMLASSASCGATVRIWDATDLSLRSIITGHCSEILSLAWHPDGGQLATGAWDGLLRIWEISSRRLRKTLKGHAKRIFSVAWSPNGEKLASCSLDDTVRIWDAHTGQVLRTLEAEKPSNVSWDPGGSRVACGCRNDVRIWEADTGRRIATLEGHADHIGQVEWSPDGSVIATVSGDKTFRLWSAASADLMWRHEGDYESFSTLAWDPSGRKLAVGNFTSLEVWDVPSKQRRLLEPGLRGIAPIAWSPGGERLAAGDGHLVGVWDVASGKVLSRHEDRGVDVPHLAWAPNGSMVAMAFGATVELRAVLGGELLFRLPEQKSHISAMAFDDRSSVIASATDGDPTRLWDCASGRLIRELEGYLFGIDSVKWHPGGEVLVASSEDGLRVWDVRTGKTTRTIEGWFSHVALSPTGNMIAAVRDSGEIAVWEAPSGAHVCDFEHDEEVRGLAWGSDDRLASGGWDMTVRIWNTADKKPKGSLEGHTGAIRAVAWDAGRQRIASAATDMSVKIWNADTGRLLHDLEGSFEPGLEFLASGHLVVSRDDAIADIWDISSLRNGGDGLVAVEPAGRLYTEPPLTGLLVAGGQYLAGPTESLQRVRIFSDSASDSVVGRPDLVSVEKVGERLCLKRPKTSAI